MGENLSDDVESDDGKGDHDENSEIFRATHTRQKQRQVNKKKSSKPRADNIDNIKTSGDRKLHDHDRLEKMEKTSKNNKAESSKYSDYTQTVDNARSKLKDSVNLNHDRKPNENVRIVDHERQDFENLNDPQLDYGIRSTISQITATLILNFLNFNYGMVVIMPTLLVGTLDSVTALNETRLTSPQLILNETNASWLGSILMLFHPLGAVLSGHLQELLGRKVIMFSINIPFLLCWMLLSSAQHVGALYVASIVMGVSLGVCEAPVASYIGEISEPKLRGAISLLTGFASSVGGLVIYVLYTYTSWRTTFLLSGVIPSISLCVIGLLPESPVFLVSKSRPDEARKSLKWLRGWIRNEDIQSATMQKIEKELQQLVNITHDSNVLYINTKIKQEYSMDHMKSVQKEKNDKTPMNAESTKEKVVSMSSSHKKAKHSIRFNTEEENIYNIEVISQRDRDAGCGVDRSHTSKENVYNTRQKLNGNFLGPYSRKNSSGFPKDIHEDHTSEEPLYTIVKVKHPKTILNLVHYTMRNEEIYRPLRMVLTVVGITTIASLTPIRPFLMEIIQMYDDKINTDDVLIGTSILNILGFFLCAVTINRLGKRRLAILSLAVNAVVSFTLGYFAYRHVSESRIPIYCIFMNSFLQGYGILQLPWILMSEVFPLEVRGIACGVCAGSAYLLQFFFTKAYLSMTGVIGLACTICMYAATGVLGIVYIYFCMPETENKTLYQIQQHFLKK